MTHTRMIEIARIDAGDRLRVLDPAWVHLLAEEIAGSGHFEPIRVVERGDGFKLIDGARRIAARNLHGLIEVEARVEPAHALADDAAVRLAEIKGNMLRAELTALDRAIYIAAWRDIYVSAHTISKGGRKAAKPTPEQEAELTAKFAESSTEAAKRALDISERSLFLSLKIAGIGRELTRRIALLPVARVQSQLLLLAEQTPARQIALVDLLTAEPANATSVTEAIAIHDRTATEVKPLPAYERQFQRFTSLKPVEKHAFFDLAADEIATWQAKRGTSRKAVA